MDTVIVEDSKTAMILYKKEYKVLAMDQINPFSGRSDEDRQKVELNF